MYGENVSLNDVLVSESVTGVIASVNELDSGEIETSIVEYAYLLETRK